MDSPRRGAGLHERVRLQKRGLSVVRCRHCSYGRTWRERRDRRIKHEVRFERACAVASRNVPSTTWRLADRNVWVNWQVGNQSIKQDLLVKSARWASGTNTDRERFSSDISQNS